MRILVVDDEPLIASTLGLIFSKQGFQVESVQSVHEALKSVQALPPDLVLCDIDMPLRDGVSLMTELGVVLPACPILVLTGYYSCLARVRECAATLPQPVSIVTKPCQPQELLRAAGDILNSLPAVR